MQHSLQSTDQPRPEHPLHSISTKTPKATATAAVLDIAASLMQKLPHPPLRMPPALHSRPPPTFAPQLAQKRLGPSALIDSCSPQTKKIGMHISLRAAPEGAAKRGPCRSAPKMM